MPARWPPPAHAQACPARPLKVVVNFPPGGAADQIARSIRPGLQAALGQPIVVEHRAGSGGNLGGNLGGDVVAKSPGDGDTLRTSSGDVVVGSPKRSPLLPDAPTLDELGLKGFDADTVFGFYAPAGTPPAVATRLSAEINKRIAAPAVNERILALGGVPAPTRPAGLAAKAAEDSKRFGAIVKERQIAGD